MKVKKGQKCQKNCLFPSNKPTCISVKLGKLIFVKKKSGFIVLGLGVSSDEQVNSGLNRSLGCRLKTVRHCKRNGSMSENFYLREKRIELFSGWFVMK